MKEMRFQVEIRAPKEKVWATLWQDETFREWAGIIDPGTHLVGDLKQGSEVQFMSGNGYGVTSLVEACKENEFLLLRHHADTQDGGERERENQWTGGKESYELAEKDGNTLLVVSFDVPQELEEYFAAAYPKALERARVRAEGASAQVDACIQALPPWQKNVCTKLRRLIHEAEPEIEETIKRGDRPYFVLSGNVCAFQATKDHINVFIYDPIAPDPQHIINQGHENKTARAIQLYEGDSIDETAFKELLRAIAKNNRAGGWRKL